jgi:hypothetical protein
MGSSIAMIDHHYGHLARDSREHAVSLLDALAIERAVDAGWTQPARPPVPLTTSVSRPATSDSRGRWTLGGRRDPKLSHHAHTKSAEQQELPESPLRDSNPGPPPYHSDSGVEPGGDEDPSSPSDPGAEAA